jgi:hypothetical protein
MASWNAACSVGPTGSVFFAVRNCGMSAARA